MKLLFHPQTGSNAVTSLEQKPAVVLWGGGCANVKLVVILNLTQRTHTIKNAVTMNITHKRVYSKQLRRTTRSIAY